MPKTYNLRKKNKSSRSLQSRLEEELSDTRNLCEHLIEQAVDAIFMINLKGHIVYANKSASRILDAPLLEIIGRHFSHFVAKESLSKAEEFFAFIKGGEVVVCEEINIVDRKGRKFPIEFSASPIYKSGRITKVHSIVRDISKRKEMEQALREGEKMKALQHFISRAAQEIKNPLKALLESTHRLIAKYEKRNFEYIGYKEFTDILKTLRSMRDQVRYCNNTTQRLLELNQARNGAGKKACDVNTVIREAARSIKGNLDIHQIELTLRLSPHLPLTKIAPLEFKEILLNVVTNAAQALPSGGKILLRSAFLKGEKMVRVDCRDNGVGIPPEDLPRVFEPFFTAKHRGFEKSSGLGLSIVYSIIKGCAGRVTIKSSLREGTMISLFLPSNGQPVKPRS